MTPFNAIILGLAAYGAVAAHAQTIESYVAPQALFPSESNYQGRVPAPLDAFDAPNGQKIGSIQIARPQCLVSSDKNKNDEACVFPLPVVYQATGKPKVSIVQMAEWSYETMGMLSYKPSIQQGGDAWSQVQHANGSVWVKTKKEEVHAYEDVAYLVDNIKTFCTEPGSQCTPVDSTVAKEMSRVTLAIGTCYDSPYTVVDRVMERGKRYYKLSIENLDPDEKTSLPSPIYVPTRNTDGSHTGHFFSRGC